MPGFFATPSEGRRLQASAQGLTAIASERSPRQPPGAVAPVVEAHLTTISFVQLVQGVTDNLDTLMSVHSTSTYRARNILVSGAISTTKCPLFQKQYVYLFYGRSEYRVDPDTGAVRDGQFKPAAFLMDTNAACAFLDKVIPTDSGGFERPQGPKRKYFHQDVKIDDITLPASVGIVRKTVRLFYRNNLRYLDYRPLLSPRIPKWAFEARSYHRMILDSDSRGFDDRASTIELIQAADVPLSAVRYVIVPSEFHNSDLLRDARIQHGFKVGYYRSNPKQTPDQTFEALRLKVEMYVRRYTKP